MVKLIIRIVSLTLVGAIIIGLSQTTALQNNETTKKPIIKKLGTIDCDMVETTPVVFHVKLYRFEYVRSNYKPNTTGDSYFRFVEVETGAYSPSFARGYHLGSAFVHDDTMFVYGVKIWDAPSIQVFWSTNLAAWSTRTALVTEGWGIFNTSVCRGHEKYIMAFEVGKPPDIAGVRFTMRFAESADLITWKILPADHVYCKERYTACPAMHYIDGYYYMIYLEAKPGPTYESHIVRSKNLIAWESSLMNPVLHYSPEDKIIANPNLTQEQRDRIARAVDINNSDVDLCEYNGKVIIYYSWGNQQGIEHLAQAEYDGTLKDFLLSFFPQNNK